MLAAMSHLDEKKNKYLAKEKHLFWYFPSHHYFFYCIQKFF